MMALQVRFAWWAKPLLSAYAVAQALRGKRADLEYMARVLARAARVTVR